MTPEELQEAKKVELDGEVRWLEKMTEKFYPTSPNLQMVEAC